MKLVESQGARARLGLECPFCPSLRDKCSGTLGHGRGAHLRQRSTRPSVKLLARAAASPGEVRSGATPAHSRSGASPTSGDDATTATPTSCSPETAPLARAPA